MNNITIEDKDIQNDIKYFKILNNNKTISFYTTNVLSPFGIENIYNKYILKLDCNNKKIINMLENIEKIVKEKFNITDNNFKSIIRKNNNYNDIIICKLKSKKNKIIVKIDYNENSNNYLKSIYDIDKNTYFKCLIEIEGLWNYNNKYGLTLIIKKIIL